MRVGFAVAAGPGAYYRAELPARILRAAGHEVVVGDQVRFGDEEWRLGVDLREGFVGNPQGLRGEVFRDDAGGEVEAFVPDVLVITGAWALALPEVLELGRAAGSGPAGRNAEQRLVVDFDGGLDTSRRRPGYHKDQVARKVATALEAERLTCATPAIARDLSTVARPTFVVRSSIDFAPFEAVRRQNADRLEAGVREGIVLGYRGTLPVHLEDVAALRPAVRSLLELGCRFVHVGARSTDRATFAEVLEIPADRVEMRLEVPFDNYPAQLWGVDVGLVPWGAPESRYHANIGGLEWTAAGVPWVATNQPEYRRLSADTCVSGRFGWASRVRELLEPHRRRAVLSEQTLAARRYDVAELERDGGSASFGGWPHALLGGLEE